MARAADFTLSRTDAGRTVVCTGDWTAIEMGDGQRAPRSGAGRRVRTRRWTCARSAAATPPAPTASSRPPQGAQAPPKLIARPEIDRLLELVERAVKAEPTPHRRAPPVQRAVRADRARRHPPRPRSLRHHGVLRPPAGGHRPGHRQSAQGALGGLLRAGRAGRPRRHPDRDGHHLLHRRGGRPAGRQHAHDVRRPGLRGRADRRGGAARVQRADHRAAAGRPLRRPASPPRSAR